MSCSRLTADALPHRPIQPAAWHTQTTGRIGIWRGVWTACTGRVMRYLAARHHARDLAEMTDRMRTDIGLPTLPAGISNGRGWHHESDPHLGIGPRPYG